MKIIIMLFAVLVLSGCGGVLYPGTYGDERISEETVGKIIPEKTRRHEVQMLLGKPQTITKSTTGDVIWSYKYIYFWMASSIHRDAVIVIGKNGVVKECRYSETSN